MTSKIKDPPFKSFSKPFLGSLQLAVSIRRCAVHRGTWPLKYSLFGIKEAWQALLWNGPCSLKIGTCAWPQNSAAQNSSEAPKAQVSKIRQSFQSQCKRDGAEFISRAKANM